MTTDATTTDASAGFCDPRFAQVREEFERNFAERGEGGASVCVTVDGEVVVDLWGGDADEDGRPWKRDTIVPAWSSTKGAVALCAHILAASGRLDFNAPVAHYWPEFAQNGKENIPVRMLLNHQAGLAVVREPLPEYGYSDWDTVVGLLAAQQPLWEPGTRSGYHALTFGHLVGEVVRRVTGQTIGGFFRETVAGPLGADFWIGLPEEHEGRVAQSIAADLPTHLEQLPEFLRNALTDPTSIPAQIMLNSGGFMFPSSTADRQINSRRFHAAEFPAAGGLANGRGLATMYRALALGGTVDGVRLVDRAQVVEMAEVSSASDIDMTVGLPTRWTLGFHPALDRTGLPGEDNSVLFAPGAFGHSGAGGALGFADPAARMSFGYAMTKQGDGVGLNSRGQSLVDAVYRALGYQRGRGLWFTNV
jgi:CubicO group peptidase (beta-lactamase class C family)